MDTSTLSNQVRQMWDTRPLRARHAPIAGVCTGFARRYQVDVALVRVAFIGATVLGGLGVIAYIAGVFALPKEEPGPAGAPEPGRTGPPVFVLIIAGVLAMIFGSDLSSSWPGATPISGALLLAGWYALHQRLPVPPPGTTVSAPIGATVGAPVAPDAPAPAPSGESEPQAGAPGPGAAATQQLHPPRWDPLGAAPFAWDLPEPAVAQHPVPTAPRSRVTSVTLGVALLTGAAIAAASLLLGLSISPVIGAAAVLAVVGTGLVVGAFRRSGYGLLAVAIPLAGFVIVGTMAQNVVTGFADAPRGELRFAVTSPGALQEQYAVQAGTLDLDLRQLVLDHDRTVTARVGMGETRIDIPAGMNVKVSCDVTVGEARCPAELNDVRTPGAPTLTIDARNNVGTVEVNRVR